VPVFRVLEVGVAGDRSVVPAHGAYLEIKEKTQVNFSGPKIFFAKFGELSKLRIWQQVTVLRR